MANKRNYEWALASVIDGFFTQDKAGGVTQRVPFSLIVSSIQGQNVFQPKGDDLTAIEAISGTGILTRTGPNTWAVVSAVAPTAHASSHHYGGGDQITGSSIAGFRISDAPRWAGVGIVAPGAAGDLDFRDTSAIRNFTIRLNTTLGQVECFSSTDAGASRSNRLILPRADASPVWIGLGLNVATGSLQVAGVDAVTSGRAGRFTGMRLTNLASGQIPVCSDGNGEITASGQTDDGTYLTSNRVFRSWNSLAKSGNTWTDFQWTQDPNERVSIFGANVAGADGFHSIVLAPYDTETTGRFLGIIHWGQRGSGRSGTAPGLKAEMLAESIGAGGGVGGFGARMRLRYRPDNGANLVDALRVGAFGGSAVDAVETAILLRASAGVQIPAITSSLLKTGSTGAIQEAVSNTDYLPASNPTATGTMSLSVSKYGVETISTSTAFVVNSSKKRMINITADTANILLSTPSEEYAGREYRLNIDGNTTTMLNIATENPADVLVVWWNQGNVGPVMYWAEKAGGWSFSPSYSANRSGDLWCDGTFWYIRW
ncbi:MAG: hypothetical protein IPO40_24775 [Fibrobacteres bacterium]|nr:hypothetical protein [Fibrobacterota bacterium]